MEGELHRKYQALFARLEAQTELWNQAAVYSGALLSSLSTNAEALQLLAASAEQPLGVLELLCCSVGEGDEAAEGVRAVDVRTRLQARLVEQMEDSMKGLLSSLKTFQSVTQRMEQLLHEACQLLSSLSAGKDSSTPRRQQEVAERCFRLVHDRSSVREGESLVFLAPSLSEYVEQVESIASMYEREYWHKQRLLEGISYHHPNQTEEKDEQREEERERMTLQNIHALWLSEPHIRHNLVNKWIGAIRASRTISDSLRH